MTRAKNKKTSEEKASDREKNRLLADGWHSRIVAAKKVKKDYDTKGMEVLSYFKADHTHLYTSPAGANFMSFDGSAMVSVPKIAQMVGSIGPRLQVTNPSRNVLARGSDGVTKGFAKLMSAMLTYTAKEGNFARHLRRTTDDGLIFGRKFLRQTWDDVRRIICSVHLPSRDVLFDPDFTTIEDARWIAIRHREPLWELKKRLPKWRTKGLERQEHCGGVVGTDPEVNDENDPEEETDDPESGSARHSVTTVEWWEILSKMGNGARLSSIAPEAKSLGIKDEEDFVRVAVVLDHDLLLEEGDWDVPLYLDREWPISYNDFVETPHSSWPESPGGQVLPLQKSIDLLTSLRFSSCKNRDRVVVFADKKIANECQETLRRGSAADFIPVNLPNGYTLDMVMKVADFGQGAQESLLERDFLEKQMEVTMGTTSMITGGQDAKAQDRSATATQARNSAAEVRVASMEARVNELMTNAARKEAIMIRLFVAEEDITPIVKADEIGMFYVSIMLPGQAEIPVRPLKVGEEADEETEEPSVLTLMDLDPVASNYFETPAASADAAWKLWQTMQTHPDPRVRELKDILLMDLDPQTMFPTAINPAALVTPERVWRDTAGLTAEELMRELSFDIEAGRGVKFDKMAERSNIDMLLQTLLPPVLQLGDFAAANKLLALRDDAYQVPKEKRVQISMPPPGQGQEQGGPERSEGKKEGAGSGKNPPKKEGK